MTAIDPENMVTEKAPKWRLHTTISGPVIYRCDDEPAAVDLTVSRVGVGEIASLATLVADANAGAQAQAQAQANASAQAATDQAGRLADLQDRIAGAIKCLEAVYDGPETPNGSAIATALGILEGDLEPDGKPWYLPREAAPAKPAAGSPSEGEGR